MCNMLGVYMVESFAIAILDVLIECEFPRLTALYNELRFASPSMRIRLPFIIL